MRTTLDLDDELMRQAKESAARTHRTLTAVVEDALRETLNRLAQPVRKGAIKLSISNKPAGICPGVDLDNTVNLLELMEQESDPARR